MTTPLRWAFPASDRILKGLAQGAGIHPFEYRARIMGEADDVTVTVTIERDGSTWCRALDVAELRRGGAQVTAFFAEVVTEMIGVGQATYQALMHHHQV